MDRSYPRNLENPRTDTALQYGRTIRNSSRAFATAVQMKSELDNLGDLEGTTATEVTNILTPSS